MRHAVLGDSKIILITCVLTCTQFTVRERFSHFLIEVRPPRQVSHPRLWPQQSGAIVTVATVSALLSFCMRFLLNCLSCAKPKQSHLLVITDFTLEQSHCVFLSQKESNNPTPESTEDYELHQTSKSSEPSTNTSYKVTTSRTKMGKAAHARRASFEVDSRLVDASPSESDAPRTTEPPLSETSQSHPQLLGLLAQGMSLLSLGPNSKL